MKLKHGKNSAMMTVELGVSLVLIVVVLFVVIGLFNDNIKTMIGSSNFSRIFSGNGLKTWFQSFNRNYDDSQIYVQIMGEQGLEMLRKKANNSDESIIENALPSGNLSGKNANTVAYLSQVIHIIMSNYEVCNKIKIQSTAKCADITGLKYNIALNGNQVTITDKSGTNLFPNAQIIVKGVSAPSISSDANPQDKLSALQELTKSYGNDINSSDALTRDISTFSSSASNVNGKLIEDELGALLGSLINSLSAAHDDCYPDGVYACLFKGNSLGSDELKDSITLINSLIDQLSTMGKTADSYIKGQYDLGYLPSTNLPAPYKPTINADNWYTANALNASLIAGSEDALVMKNLQDDPLSLLAPAGDEPIIGGSSDAYAACADGETACSDCSLGGGNWTGTSCKCPTGKTWSGSVCVTSGGSGGSGGTTCPADSLFDDINMKCVTCPAPGQLDVNGACCNTGAVNNSGACCSSGFLDQTGNCGVTVTCDAPGKLDSNGKCCASGQVNKSGVCCPTNYYLDQAGICTSYQYIVVTQYDFCPNIINSVSNLSACQQCVKSGGEYIDQKDPAASTCRCPSAGTTYNGSICVSTDPNGNICGLNSLGIKTSCSSTTDLTATYSNTYASSVSSTSNVTATFALNYAKSNLNTYPYIFDSRLKKVSTYVNRVKILSVYNDMVNKLLTNSDLLFFLRQDKYEGSCEHFKSMLRTITNERGLKSANALITDSICNGGDGPQWR